MELLSFLNDKKIIRPRYTTLQDMISNAINTERNRLNNIINNKLNKESKSALQKLLLQDGILSGLAALKQDAKDFKSRMIV
jgi:hypothetical protein